MTDTERINWLEKQNGCNLISDDYGRWAVSTSGIQKVPATDPTDMMVASFVEAHEWKPSIREAIDYVMHNSKFEDISNKNVTCSKCNWQGKVKDLKMKEYVVHNEIEKEPCCPKCNNTILSIEE